MRRRSGNLAKFLAGIAPMSSPSNMITPSLLSMRRMIMVDVVDLPQPDSPTRPTLSPRATVKLMPSTARKVSGSGAGFGAKISASPSPSRLRGYSLTSFSTNSSGAPPLACERAAESVRAELDAGIAPRTTKGGATSSPPPLAGEGQGGGAKDDGAFSATPSPPLPRTRGREQTELAPCPGRRPTSPSGTRSRSDAPGRGVARISLRV